MQYVDLDLCKQNLRLDSDDEDELLTSMIEAASNYVEGFLANPPDTTSSPPDEVPQEVQQATMMLVAAWFDNRETIVGTSSQRELPKELPYGVEYILRNLRGWSFG